MLKPGDLAPAFHLQPVFGLPVDLDALCAKTPVILVFLRPATATQTRLAVEHLHALMPRLEADGVPIIGFIRGDRERVWDFVPRHHVLFPVIYDEKGTWFDAYGVTTDRWYLGTLKGVRLDALKSAVSALTEGRGPVEAENNTLPAELVVGPGRRVIYARYGDSILHQPDIEALWEATRAP